MNKSNSISSNNSSNNYTCSNSFVQYNIWKIFGVANESVFKNDLRVIDEEFEMFVQPKATQSVGKFEIDTANQRYTSDDKFVYNKNKTEIIMYYKVESSVEIPECIKIIGDLAFHNKTMIKNIIIPNTVEEIKTSFNYCSGLTSITIPNSVEKISSMCFSSCNNLTQINIDKEKDSISGAP